MKLKKFWIIVIALIGALFFLMVKFIPTNSAELSASGNSTPLSNESYTITLITGDQVSVNINSEGLQTIDITPAERDGYEVGFEKIEVDGEVYVIPEDVLLYIPDKLDRELFNVTKLSREGYHDENMDYIPLIIMLKEQSTLKEVKKDNHQMFGNSIANQHVFSSINGMSAHVNKGQVQSFNKALFVGNENTFQSTELFSNTIKQIRLDRKVNTSLEESVPQIGAPKAWDSDYDGTGVVVAVLDTGIDSNHPDLTGKIVEARNFSSDENVEDLNGHGTHVASTIAGTGIASDGAKKGVAPGASLINAKVLDKKGNGFESDVIEGIEWSAGQGADIINVSLGSVPTDGTDPVSQAVNVITEEKNVLFVIAAGNSGPRNEAVTAPGTADAALTVGSVDKEDRLAFDSSRGPRKGDYAIKPDITAPGVDIIAARAEGTSMGAPINSYYTKASGTSMATPHVAGAAALLVEKWKDTTKEITPKELKDALISTATPQEESVIPIEDLTIYKQGAGRLNVDRVINQNVFAGPSPLNMGFFTYPHENRDLVTKKLTYSNMLENDVTLTITADIKTEKKKHIPDDMIVLSANEITIKSGQTEEIEVTIDPKVGELGLHGGYIIATSKDETIAIHTPIGFYKELEMYSLTIEGTTEDGRPANPSSSYVDVMNVEDRGLYLQNSLRSWDEEGRIEIQVPAGIYSVVTKLEDRNSKDRVTIMGDPELKVVEDTTVIYDAREASELTVNLEDDINPKEIKGSYYRKAANNTGSLTHHFSANKQIFMDTMQPVKIGEFELKTQWLFNTKGSETDIPSFYNLIFAKHSIDTSNLHHEIKKGQLAQVNNMYFKHYEQDQYKIVHHHFRPYSYISFGITEYLTAGQQRMEYFIPDDTTYKNIVQLNNGITLENPEAHYKKGKQEVTWFKQPIRPGVLLGNEPIYRDGDQLNVLLPEYLDTDNHWGYVSGVSKFRLFENEELIAETSRARGEFPLNPKQATYRMELTTKMNEEWSPFSTTTRTNWTFHSDRPSGNEQVNVPLLLVNYDKDLNLDNSDKLPSEADGPNTLDLHVMHQPWVEGLTVEGAKLWLSYNDGEDWKEIKNIQDFGEGHFQANLDRGDHEGSGYVSLKVEAWDTEKNKIEQEIIRAYRVANK